MNTLAIHPADDIDLRPVLRRGFLILTLGLGGFLAVAAWAPVDQALAGSGTLGAASQRQAVQHPAGGTVLTLEVQEGDLVRAGQVLLTLDVAPQRAELESTQRQALLLGATQERLQALLGAAPGLSFSPALQTEAERLSGGAALLATQARLFQSQRAGQGQGQSQLQSRAAQLRAQLAGQLQQLEQAQAQRQLAQDQTRQLEDLTNQGFYPRLKLADAQRQLNAARADEARVQTELQRAREALVEANATEALRGSEHHRSWESELLEAARQHAQLRARAATLQHLISQSRLLAPVSGSVVGLNAHTVGGVVAPGQTVMELVPRDDSLVVDARFPLSAAEKLRAGQNADLHFNSMDRSRTPVVTGQVLTVSADRMEDARNGAAYMRVRVAVPQPERARLQASGASLRAGLPVDVMVQLGERSLLSYLVKPLSDRLAHAMTE